MSIPLGYGLVGLVGVGIILIGARFLWNPRAAATGFGIPGEPLGGQSPQAWLAVKGVRDIVAGLLAFSVMINAGPRALGWFMLTASVIPACDAAIVLRSGGTRAVAYGIHGATAVVMLAIGALLILG